mmetsp:Transcript_23100/g.33565  ORF Transcript_23100/g.33565 Transcript_23100/m.33565 type:complete len:279 (+) Transcript_23100:291-1127(+)
MSSTRASQASSLGIPLWTTSLPTYRSTFPGAPPTYPKSASAISPTPFTMQPMTAIDTPGRCPVWFWMLRVTSCRSNRVRPQDGQDTYSVLVLRIREPWSRPKEVFLTSSMEKAEEGASIMTPSPRPSTSRDPAPHPLLIRNSSVLTSPSNCREWMTGVAIWFWPRKVKRRREACRRLTPSGHFRSNMTGAGDRVFRTSMASSDSAPEVVTASRAAPLGRSTFPPRAAASSREMTATALGRGLASSFSISTRTPTETSCSLRSAVLASVLSSAGTPSFR